MATYDTKYPHKYQDSFDLNQEDLELVYDRSVRSLPAKKGSYVGLIVCLFAIILIASAWFAVRPGVFTIQPMSALPYGVTILYYSRAPGMPFFSSPDGLCLVSQGSVSLDCRIAAFAKAAGLSNRIILQLPYLRWAYLRSTGGAEYGQ